MLAAAPKGDGRPVLALPGLFVSDRSNFIMRRYLSALGYRAFGWGLGHNFSLRTIGADGEKLGGRIAAIAEETGEPVTLIGVSLGGIMARFAAQRWPDQVREVRSEEHTSELQSLMRISYAVFCLKKKKKTKTKFIYRANYEHY